MKIAICGSVSFSREMLETKAKLEALGHAVATPKGIEQYVSDPSAVESKWEKLQFDVIKKYYNEIKRSDAILVLNYDKKGIENYVGGNTLIEIAFAHVLDKKVFLLNPIPRALGYSDEIEAMKPVVIYGKLSRIM